MKLLFVPKTEEEIGADLACQMDDGKFPPPPYKSSYSMYSFESSV